MGNGRVVLYCLVMNELPAIEKGLWGALGRNGCSLLSLSLPMSFISFQPPALISQNDCIMFILMFWEGRLPKF